MSKNPTITIYAVDDAYGQGQLKVISAQAELRGKTALIAKRQRSWRFRAQVPLEEVHTTALDAARAYFRQKDDEHDLAVQQLEDAARDLADARDLLREHGGNPDAEAAAAAAAREVEDA